MRVDEFLIQSHLDAHVLDGWVDAGWLRPRGNHANRDFSEVDLARARLIGDLRHNLDVNDEAVPIVLDLIDQIHGLRRLVRELVKGNRR